MEGGIIVAAVKDLFRFVDRDAMKVAADAGEIAPRDAVTAVEHAALDEGRGSAAAAARDAENRAVETDARTTTSDPIDVASGEVILRQTDVALPGVLPLVLERTHVSSYRCGRWFGISWASTLDQHLEVTDDGVHLAAADGMVLAYPPAGAPEAPLLAAEGPYLPLTPRADGSYTVEDPRTGRTLHFRPVGASRELPLAAVTDRNGNRIDVLRGAHGAPVEVRHSGGHRVAVDIEGGRIRALRLVTGVGGVPVDPATISGAPAEDGASAARTPAARPEPRGGSAGAAGAPARDARSEDRPGRHALHGGAEPAPVGAAGEPAPVGAGGEAAAGGPQTVGPEAGGGVVLARFGYDERGHLTEVATTDGAPLRFGYDADGRLTGWADRNGFWYRYEYDGRGRGVRGHGSDGVFDSTLAYGDGVTVVTDALGDATTYRLDERGRVVAETDPLGNTYRREWDARGRLLAETDPLGRTTRHVYDEAGNVLRIERPDGARITAEYDARHMPVAVTEADGAAWRNRYDERGNLVELVDPAGAVTRFGHDERGAVTSVADPAGGRTVIVADAAGLPVARTDPAGAVTRYRRDALGRVREMVDPAGGVTRLSWSVDGRLLARTWPSGATETWRYDGEGNPVEHVDPLGRVTRTEYGPFDAPTARTGPDGARLEYAYDRRLRLVGVTGPRGERWRYEYDAAGRLVREIDFDGRASGYAYDAAGRLVRRVNAAGEVIGYEYDAMGDVVRIRTETGETTFGYDPAGRLVRAANADARVELRRDPLGRVTTESVNGRVLRSAYDAAGRRVLRRTPSGAESAWEYDAAGRPVAVRTGGQVVRFGYDAAGREVRREIGAGAILSRVWDADHRTIAQTLWGAPVPSAPPPARRARLLEHRAYAYRPDGNVAGVRDTAGERRFELDAAGRVTAVHGRGWAERYAYDPAGNLTEASWPGADQDAHGPREYAGTLVRRAGRVHYEYDAQGRVVTRTRRTLSGRRLVWRYTWDAEDRLAGLVTPDGRTWRYRYDPFGRRIAKQLLAPGGSGVAEQTDVVWDGPVPAEQAHTVTGAGAAVPAGAGSPPGANAAGGPALRTTTWDYEPGTFRPLAQTDRTFTRGASPDPDGHGQDWYDERFYGIVTDLIGTPTEMVDAAGNVVWRHRSTLWGVEVPAGAGAAHCPLRFPGQYHDAESLLHYNVNRYYDPETGRYTAPDPLGLAPAPNPRTYVPNPLTWYDPLGLAPYRVYDDSEYGKHGATARSTAHGVASPAPKNGQAALDRSFDPSPDNPAVFRRYGVDYENQQIVVLDRHRFITDKEGNITKEWYHGHVPDPKTIPPQITTKLRRMGMIDKKFRVLPE